MNNTFLDFLTRLGSNPLTLAAPNVASAASHSAPRIALVAVFDPDPEQLADPVWFHVTDPGTASTAPQTNPNGAEPTQNSAAESPNDTSTLRQVPSSKSVNGAGLLNGLVSLVGRFEASEGPFHMHTAEGAIFVLQLEPRLMVAVTLAVSKDTAAAYTVLACLAQLEVLVRQCHATFTVTQPGLDRLRTLYGDGKVSEMLQSHWTLFMAACNRAWANPRGPLRLLWPNALNPRGFFSFLGPGSYKRSLARVPEEAFAAAVFQNQNVKACVVVSVLPLVKDNGVLYLDAGSSRLERGSMVHVAQLVADLHEQNLLDPLAFHSLPWQHLQTAQSRGETTPTPSAVEPPEEDAPGSMLSPLNLTQALVVLPLQKTVAGFRTLGLSVSHIYEPVWLPWAAPPEPLSPLTSQEAPTVEPGLYIVGMDDSSDTSLLIYAQDNTGQKQQYLVVAYQHNHLVVVAFFESGCQGLSQRQFYQHLQTSLFEPVVQSVAAKAPLGSDEPAPDNGFFFLIFDHSTNSYQTSLPDLGPDTERVVFHLHDQLTKHYVLEQKGNLLSGAVAEHVHKFSSSKNNDWLFYTMRRRHTTVVVIRNYNHRQKNKPPALAEHSYLDQVAGLYGAPLAFLDTIGSDVKVWLNGVPPET